MHCKRKQLWISFTNNLLFVPRAQIHTGRHILMLFLIAVEVLLFNRYVSMGGGWVGRRGAGQSGY